MQKVTNQEFIRAWNECEASPSVVAKHLGLTIRAVYDRRNSIEEREGITLRSLPLTPQGKLNLNAARLLIPDYSPRALSEISNGVVIVFSDAHYQKGSITLAHKALVKLCKELKPKMVVANGDILDGATISSHARIGWERRQTLRDELEEVQERLAEIEDAAGGNCRMHRTIGNHDIRFDRRLATHVSEYEGIRGMALKDHIPRWTDSWSLMINENVMVKHRWHNGVHAQWNNVLKAGIRAIVTGHLHRLMVTSHGDYSGRKWGVDTGTLADVDGPQFHYTEDNPVPWASGFAVLTFYNGMLMPPELCEVVDGIVWFRGQKLDVGNEQTSSSTARSGRKLAGTRSKKLAKPAKKSR